MGPITTKKNGELQVVKPEMALDKFASQKSDILALVSKEMKSDKDYGVIPGTTKKTLYLAGAEKLAKFFGLAPTYTLTKEIENFEPTTAFVYYRYRCTLTHLATGITVGDCERSCNSRETKYRNKTIYDLANTCKAMAQKRALVSAVRTATMASDIFDSDIDEDGKTGPTTKASNPVRTNMVAKLHAVARPRGFTDELLHKIVFEKYEVESITELDGTQLNEIIEKLLANYSIVKEGEKPVRIAPVAQEEPKNEIDKAKEEIKESGEEKGEVSTIPTNCKQCDKPLGENPFSPYFCSQECSDEYWKPTKHE